ncbi:MAG: hypothetical protein EXR71_08615 [Myxococcales bacterium]|nr:hypothetical protein [Myxococcales bacterium]
MTVLLWLLACEAPLLLEAPAAAVYVDARRASSGGAIALRAPPGSTVEGSTGMVVADGSEGQWTLSGADGSYIVTVSPPGGEAVRIFVDIGVDGPTGGPMDELQQLPPPAPPVWPWVAASLVVLAAALAVAAWAWKRLKPVPPAPAPMPAHLVAHRAWVALRSRTGLRPEQVAGQMSDIFRTWLDADLRFPATQRTRREILDVLAGYVTAAELDAARRLLSATDLVKFAERSEHADLFDRLDHDFYAIVCPVRRA